MGLQARRFGFFSIPGQLLSGLLVFAVAWVPGAEGAPAGAAPIITFDQPSHDLGVVPEGPAARHVFKLRNTGSAPLEILGVSASCGCTAAAPKEKVIAPGKDGEIQVTFDTRGRPGKNLKTVTVVSNDPKTPSTTLTLKVEVDQLLAFQPIESYLAAVEDKKVTQEAWLVGKRAAGAKLKLAKVDPRGPIEVELISRKGPAGERQQGLRFSNAPKQAGNGTVRVVLSTGLPDPTEVVHLVRWSVLGNIQAPDAVYLDLQQAGGGERVIQVRSRRPDFRLKAARVLKGPFKAELLSNGPGGAGAGAGFEWSVKISTTLAAAPAAPTSGKLVLESNDPLQPKKDVLLALEPRRPSAPAAPPARPAPH